MHFIDKVNGISKHAIEKAIILSSKGAMVGKIAARFTAASIGCNHEVGMIFNHGDSSINFATTKKRRNLRPGVIDILARQTGRTIV